MYEYIRFAFALIPTVSLLDNALKPEDAKYDKEYWTSTQKTDMFGQIVPIYRKDVNYTASNGTKECCIRPLLRLTNNSVNMIRDLMIPDNATIYIEDMEFRLVKPRTALFCVNDIGSLPYNNEEDIPLYVDSEPCKYIEEWFESFFENQDFSLEFITENGSQVRLHSTAKC